MNLKEDRVIWVRAPPGHEQSKSVYPAVYQTDGPGHVNEIGSTTEQRPLIAVVPAASSAGDCGRKGRGRQERRLTVVAAVKNS